MSATKRFKFFIYLNIFSFRYTAVCQPFAYRAVSLSSNVNHRVFRYLIIIIIISCMVNVSRFFETRLITKSVNVSNGDSFEVETRVSFELTELRKHPEYIRYGLAHQNCSPVYIVQVLHQLVQTYLHLPSSRHCSHCLQLQNLPKNKVKFSI